MDTYLPELSDYADPEEWLFDASLNYSIALRECREEGDTAGREYLLKRLKAVVEKSIEINVLQYSVFSLLARHTPDPRERLRLYSFAYQSRIADPAAEYDFDEQASAIIEAGQYSREMGLAHEALGEKKQAADCFTRALAHLQQGSDLFETHCLSAEPDNPEEEHFPLRPRLVTDLERVKKCLDG